MQISFTGLLGACSSNKTEDVEKILSLKPDIALNRNIFYSWPPGFLLPLPLLTAVEYNAKECAEILVKHGADPDLICNKRKKSARQLKPEWFENIPKQEERFAEKSD